MKPDRDYILHYGVQGMKWGVWKTDSAKRKHGVLVPASHEVQGYGGGGFLTKEQMEAVKNRDKNLETLKKGTKEYFDVMMANVRAVIENRKFEKIKNLGKWNMYSASSSGGFGSTVKSKLGQMRPESSSVIYYTTRNGKEKAVRKWYWSTKT